jgi:YbbR domain-containing protein
MIRRFFTKNLHLKILALAAACVFWFFVLSSENTFYAFPDHLSIEPFNVPEGLAVVNELGTAEITVRASQEVYKALTPENFTVYVDLQNLAAGSKQVDLSVNSKKTDVSVVSISPETITVVLEDLTTKDVPLTYALAGDPAENYSALLSDPGPTTITVSGAESVLAEIDSAVATLNLQGDETETTTATTMIVVLDEDGDELTTLESSPAEVDLTAQITLMEAQKTIGIKVEIGDLKTGYLDSIKTSPLTIQVKGDADLLEDITYLTTDPIDIPAGKEVYKTDATFVLPEGVTLVDNETKVEVTLTLGGL